MEYRGGDPLNNQPLKVIELNFHIIQRSDGSGNPTPASLQRFQHIVDLISQKFTYSFPSDPQPGFPQLPNYDTQIRFAIDDLESNVHFYPNDSMYDNYIYPRFLRYFLTDNYPERINRYNIWFTPYYMLPNLKVTVINGGSGYTSIPVISFNQPYQGFKAEAVINNGQITSIKITQKPWLYFGGIPLPEPVVTITGGGGSGALATAVVTAADGSYEDINGIMLYRRYNASDESVANLLAHELGHFLNLQHVHDDDDNPEDGQNNDCNISPDLFLEDVFGIPQPGNCPHLISWGHDVYASNNDRYTNNLMTYGIELQYLSPLQTGYAHQALCTGYQTKYVKDSYIDIPYCFDANANIYHNLYLYRDLIINNEINVKFSYPYNDGSKKLVLPSASNLEIYGSMIIDTNFIIEGFSGQGFGGNINIYKHGKFETVSNGLLKLGSNAIMTIHDGGKAIIKNSSLNQNAQIIIESGGTLILKQCSLSQDASIIIKPGGKIQQSGIIELSDNAYVTIERNQNLEGEIEILSLSFIHLNSCNTQFKLFGKLVFPASGKSPNLKISGQGTILFNGQIQNNHLLSKLAIEGNNSEQILLRVGIDVFPVKTSEFIFRNVKVLFETIMGQIKSDQPGTAVTAENVLFTAPAGQKFNYGLNITSPSQASITNCIFEHGKTGISIINTTGMVPQINSCTFDDMCTCIALNGGSAAIDGCSFLNSNMGISTLNMDHSSTLYGCMFRKNQSQNDGTRVLHVAGISGQVRTLRYDE